MIYHRYPMRSLVRDYIRAVGGFLVGAVPLTLGNPGTAFTILLGSLAVLFFGYGLRTLLMQLTAFEIRPDGLAVHGPRRRFFAWDGLSSVRLRYFSTQRDKERRDLKSGWLELKLTGEPGTLRVDSALEGFPAILEAVARAAEQRTLALDETTVENLKVFREKTAADENGTEGDADR
jgi:hypothetical protein